MSDPIAFSEDQQFAVLGHALGRPQLWDVLLDLGVTKEWLLNERLRVLWDHVEGFKKKYEEWPRTQEELVAYVKTIEGHTDYVRAAQERIATARVAAKRIRWETLEPSLIQWAKSTSMVRNVLAIRDKYNAGNHADAYELYQQGATELQRLDLHRGARDQMISSRDRAKLETKIRYDQGGKHLEYGIPYLDDAMGGILLNDFVILGGYTSSGKTEAARIVAEHNALQGKQVGFFALEAEEHEIERRIKFAYMASRYREQTQGTYEPGYINYADWRFRRLPQLEQYEDEATAYVEDKLANLKTYYRSNNDFSLHTLDREVMRHHKGLDLVVLDHLHYVDTEGENENREMNLLVKKIRDLVLDTGIPVVAVVHLRKRSGAETSTVIPNLDTVHGSSNITKICTSAIIMGPARGLNITDTTAVPATHYHTFMRPAKFRLDGSRTKYVGLTFFDPYSHTYAASYAIGRLNVAETSWSVLEDQNMKPRWAKRADVWGISSEEK